MHFPESSSYVCKTIKEKELSWVNNIQTEEEKGIRFYVVIGQKTVRNANPFFPYCKTLNSSLGLEPECRIDKVLR